jgi:hypothetical protein
LESCSEIDRQESMDEEELDSMLRSRPFTTADVVRFEAQAGHLARVGRRLWGRTSADLQRQLLERRPEIPSGVELADLRDLQAWVQEFVDALSDPKRPWLLGFARSTPVIAAGDRRFTEWEARLEVVRRAIEYFETR